MAWRDRLAPWPEDAPAPALPAPAQSEEAPAAPTILPMPGVPLDWCRGVARLVRMPPSAVKQQQAIPGARWRLFQEDAARLYREHGAALHAAGWDALHLFGLHRTAPAANPTAWGLAWLLAGGEVLDVAADQVGIRRGPKGWRLAFQPMSTTARATAVLAWELEGNADGT